MTCRHAPGDRSCTQQFPTRPEPPQTPDASLYEVLDVDQVNNHLVMRLRYPNCARCDYEGVKVLVFLDTTAMVALKWKRIDPHFRDPKVKRLPTEAPGPAARFPGSDQGWSEALRYAGSTRGGA
jgi:hypothetical protein